MARYSPKLNVQAGPGTADNPTLSLEYDPAAGQPAVQSTNATYGPVHYEYDGTRVEMNTLNITPVLATGDTVAFLGNVTQAVSPNGVTYDELRLFYNNPSDPRQPPYLTAPASNLQIDIGVNVNNTQSQSAKCTVSVPTDIKLSLNGVNYTYPGLGHVNSMSQFTPRIHFDSNDNILLITNIYRNENSNNISYMVPSGDFKVSKYAHDPNTGLMAEVAATVVSVPVNLTGVNGDLYPQEYVTCGYHKSTGLVFAISGSNNTEDYIQIMSDPFDPNTLGPRIQITGGRGGFGDNWKTSTEQLFNQDTVQTAGRCYRVSVFEIDNTPVIVLGFQNDNETTGVSSPYPTLSTYLYYNRLQTPNLQHLLFFTMDRLNAANVNSTVAAANIYAELQTTADPSSHSATDVLYDSYTGAMICLQEERLLYNYTFSSIINVGIIDPDILRTQIQSLDLINTVLLPNVSVPADVNADASPNLSRQLVLTGYSMTVHSYGVITGILLDNTGGNLTGNFVTDARLATAVGLHGLDSSFVEFYGIRDMAIPRDFTQALPPGYIQGVHNFTYGYLDMTYAVSATPYTDSSGRWAFYSRNLNTSSAVTSGTGAILDTIGVFYR